MRILLLSDLHNEFGDFIPPADIVETVDVIVLAGDIHTNGQAAAWAKSKFKKPVVLVGGNHDYYGERVDLAIAQLRADAMGSNVHYLENDEVVIGGVRFLGTTLWTDYRVSGNQPLAMLDSSARMEDHNFILNEIGERWAPEDALDRHMASRKWLEDSLDRPYDGPTFVVTHHCPCELSIPEHFKDSGHLNASYASRLDHLMGERVDVWAHGHTHTTHAYDVYGTKVFCNPRGYVGVALNMEFNPGFVIQISA